MSTHLEKIREQMNEFIRTINDKNKNDHNTSEMNT